MANKITTDTEVSTSELACVLGITARYVRQLTEDGQLEKVKQGRYMLCASVQKYIDSREAVTEDEVKLEKAKRAAEVTLKTSKAHIAKMEADELRGKMHRSEDVEAMTADLIYTIRGSLLALPGRLAIDVAAVKTPAEAAEVIRRGVTLLMQELSQYQYDPKKYEERVRKRMAWDIDIDTGEDEDA
ncbi:MAG: hypothetical protein HFF17_13270 [Oscillospiraceae bacterium]|nr:hypothetical protein [Oscillospiraceae bacterium]